MLRVRTLGEFAIDQVDLSQIRSRKARTAVKVLALARGRPVSVDRLVECLWPDDARPREPEREVAVNLSRARSVLGRDRIVRSDAGYHLLTDWLDLDVLDELADEARRRLSVGDHAAARTAAAAGLALARGPLLADEGDAPWVEIDRAVAQRTTAMLRQVAAETALAVGDPGQAATLAERVLTDDPFDETATRLLMRAHTMSGRSGSAMSAYAALRQRLVTEPGAGPSAETEALHLAILLDNDTAISTRANLTHDQPPDLPGRAGVLDQLGQAHRDATAGLELVVIDGDAGIGKSRVLDSFAARAALAGAVVLVGRCDELGLALPLRPIADALSSYLHRLDPDRRNAALGDDAAVVAPLLGSARLDAPRHRRAGSGHDQRGHADLRLRRVAAGAGPHRRPRSRWCPHGGAARRRPPGRPNHRRVAAVRPAAARRITLAGGGVASTRRRSDHPRHPADHARPARPRNRASPRRPRPSG